LVIIIIIIIAINLLSLKWLGLVVRKWKEKSQLYKESLVFLGPCIMILTLRQLPT